jgi:DNA-directed RNA polymerase specialized sigma24 family protein
LHEAEDLTQEVQVRLYLARLRGVSITPGYWHSTCRSVLNDYLRHLRQQRQ